MSRCTPSFLPILIFLFATFASQSQTLCTSSEIRTEITIDNSAANVWNVLLNVSDYPNWHPYISSIEGELKLHKKIKVHTIDQERKAGQFKAYILALEPNKLLAWGGSLGFIFRAKHYFIIEVIDASTTRLIQGEYWKGWFGKSYGKKIYQKTFDNFTLMNEKVKARLEKNQYKLE